MRRIGLLMVAALVVMGLAVGTAFATGNPTFGVTTNASKIGDAYGTPTWGGGFHSIAVKDSVVYAGYTNNNINNEVEAVVGISYDGGHKWEHSDVVAHGQIDFDGIALAIGPDSSDPNRTVIHVAWGEYDPSVSREVIKYSNSASGRWSSPITISGADGVQGHRRSIATDPLGGVHIAYNENDGDVCYVKSTDYGSSFSAPDCFGNGNAEPSIAADSQGNVFIAWNWWNNSSDNGVKLSTPVGPNWITTTISGSYSGGYPSIAVYDANNIYVAWHASGIVVAKTSNGGTSWAWDEVSTTGDDPCVIVDGTNTPSVAWDGSNGMSFSRWMGNKWATPTLVVSDSSYGPNLAVDRADGTNKIYMMYPDKFSGGVYFTLGQ